MLPQHNLSFMQENTLTPQMIKLYILMKVIKELTKEEGKPEAKSYHIKSAIAFYFGRHELNDDDLGKAALHVMKERYLKGKYNNVLYSNVLHFLILGTFSGINQIVKKLGYTEVDLSCLPEGVIVLKK